METNRKTMENNLIDIKNYLFRKPTVFRDKDRLLLKSTHTQKGHHSTTYFLEIIRGVYTDEELFKICYPLNEYGGKVHSTENGVTQVIIYNA